ncbi:DUF3108 domain-containing protein [Massilia sp. CF038]|uniref:DUF3108 domain-containing protein n=1 Tax=Massilia sp. CF038 TaxID=1881045 RepID=UPI0009174CB0|nr:DUF3108 domain-containing protein [Massilia sp. CF038]SHH63685.1 Protein of unknown function [Massilia sp. CF038]
MTIASALFRQRRVLALCLATVLLHYVAINWAGAHLAAASAPDQPARPPVIVAQLKAPPVPVPAPPVSAPAALPAPVPKPKRARPAPAPEVPAAAQVESNAPIAEPQVQSPEPVVAAEPVPAVEPAPEQAPDPAPAPAHYSVSLPPSASLNMDVTRTDAKGVNWSGQAVMDWRQTGGAYRMSVVASVTVVVSINLVELASEGTLGEAGIIPRTMTEKRRNRSETATHFDAQQGKITFSAVTASFPMPHGAQDKATFPMQLAGIGRADKAQLAAGVEMVVGDNKDASPFRFVLVGEEEIDTPLGKLATWHMTRPPLPGSYNSRLDVWLAPAHDWYPVQLRSTESSGAVTTQTVRKIVPR